MKWSKLKAAVEDRLAPSLKGRLAFHATRYGPGVSSLMTRAWVTLDGQEIVHISTMEWWERHRRYVSAIRDSQRCQRLEGAERQAGYDRSYHDATVALRRSGCYSRDDFIDSLEAYLDLSLDAALQSSNSVVLAIAMVDKRFGKRRLVKVEEQGLDHPLVKQFYQVRCEAEGLLSVP